MNTNTIARPVSAPVSVTSKTVTKPRYEIKSLADSVYRVYDHQTKEFVGNATENLGTAKTLLRKLESK
jgi:hypothetical protein